MPEGEQVILGQDLLEVMGVLIVAFVRVDPAALTEDGEVTRVNGEAIAHRGLRGEISEELFGDFQGSPTFAAYQMGVGGPGEVVDGRPVSQMGVHHDL